MLGSVWRRFFPESEDSGSREESKQTILYLLASLQHGDTFHRRTAFRKWEITDRLSHLYKHGHWHRISKGIRNLASRNDMQGFVKLFEELLDALVEEEAIFMITDAAGDKYRLRYDIYLQYFQEI